MKITIKEFCDKYGAHGERTKFAIENCKTMTEVWNTCKPELLVWIFSKVFDDKACRLFAVWCAMNVSHVMRDERSVDVIKISERFANGKASNNELFNAYLLTKDLVAADTAIKNASRSALITAYDSANIVDGTAYHRVRNAQAKYIRKNHKCPFED